MSHQPLFPTGHTSSLMDTLRTRFPTCEPWVIHVNDTQTLALYEWWVELQIDKILQYTILSIYKTVSACPVYVWCCEMYYSVMNNIWMTRTLLCYLVVKISKILNFILKQANTLEIVAVVGFSLMGKVVLSVHYQILSSAESCTPRKMESSWLL